MLQQRSNCINLVIMICLWTVTSFSYYCVNFNIKYFNGSIYTNGIWFSLAGILGNITFSLMIQFYTSTKVFIIWFLVSFIGSVGYWLSRSIEPLVPIWILIMVYVLTISFSMCYYANVCLFPAIHRTKIFAVCNIVSRSFTILAPMSVELMDDPIIIVAVASFFMIFLSSQLRHND